MHLQVLYEDNHLIAVNKPAGYLVQGDQTGDLTMADFVKQYIKIQYNKPGDVFLGTIHRLDRPVSGVLIYARTSKGLTRMNELFQKRQIEKLYWAVTLEQPDPLEGKLTHYILKDKTKNRAKAFDRMSRRSEGAKKAELEYRMLGRIASHVLQEVKLGTGRPHQIRVQLAKIIPLFVAISSTGHQSQIVMVVFICTAAPFLLFTRSRRSPSPSLPLRQVKRSGTCLMISGKTD